MAAPLRTFSPFVQTCTIWEAPLTRSKAVILHWVVTRGFTPTLLLWQRSNGPTETMSGAATAVLTPSPPQPRKTASPPQESERTSFLPPIPRAKCKIIYLLLLLW